MNDQLKTPETNRSTQKDELAAYEKLRQYARESLASVRDNVNAETISHAVDTAAARVRSAGTFTSETTNRAVTALRKDLTGVAQKLGPRWDAFSEKSGDVFNVWRDRGTTFLGQAASATGAWLESTGNKLKHSTYVTGEMYSGGPIACRACGARIDMPGPGHVPPCPQCMGTTFERI
jgi:hypothetical protein